MLNDKWQGLIIISFGIIVTLKAWGIYPRKARKTDNGEEPFRQFTPAMKALGPIIVIFGLLLLLGVIV